MRTQVQYLALLSGLRIWHCRDLWCRSQIRLGSRVAEAVASGTALIGPLDWELPYAMGTAPKRKKKKQSCTLNCRFDKALQVIKIGSQS